MALEPKVLLKVLRHLAYQSSKWQLANEELCRFLILSAKDASVRGRSRHQWRRRQSPDLSQGTRARSISVWFLDAASLTGRLPSTSHCTPPRRRTRWHLPRRAAACGLAGALLGPAAVGVSALKARALVAVFQSPRHCVSTRCSASFLWLRWDVMVTERCDGD